MSLALFTLAGDQLVPTSIARSMWSENQMHGVAVSGALARGVEQQLAQLGRTELRPARWAVDLFRPATMEPCTVATRVVREGRRIVLVDADLRQGDAVVARASAVHLLPTENPEGRVWSSRAASQPPPLEQVPASDEPRVPFFDSGAGWSQDFAEHQNDGRKRTWQTGLPVVAGERPSGFVAVASVADSASMVLHWGTGGVQYINTDLTLTLARAPYGVEVGLEATDRVEHDGIAVGTVAVLDRHGPLGHVTVTALANARRPVDFERVEYDDDGGRRVRD
ncbi:thioesterase family protein [Nocardioides sp. HDW12B]|uniref:thioesterase family protein n=1 Tax=Nocardioides sp. HDW12B TaxID=2714939 RepID=UPI00140C9354|nr:thioesterase family protein [Nocardioides sp. HDW12B]QIK65846.1 thioesterase family protein [Nocardioides sp. HDW12B]